MFDVITLFEIKQKKGKYKNFEDELISTTLYIILAMHQYFHQVLTTCTCPSVRKSPNAKSKERLQPFAALIANFRKAFWHMILFPTGTTPPWGQIFREIFKRI